MEKTIRMPINAFKLYARNMHSETYSESGFLVKVSDRVVEVLDGEVTLGEYNCVYTCDDKNHSIDVGSDVKVHSETYIDSNASGCEGGPDDSHGYLAKVRVIDKVTHYNSGDQLPVEGSDVIVVECV